jgi:hypothetical protein
MITAPTIGEGNQLSDFPADQFGISLASNSCDHRVAFDGVEVPETLPNAS